MADAFLPSGAPWRCGGAEGAPRTRSGRSAPGRRRFSRPNRRGRRREPPRGPRWRRAPPGDATGGRGMAGRDDFEHHRLLAGEDTVNPGRFPDSGIVRPGGERISVRGDGRGTIETPTFGQGPRGRSDRRRRGEPCRRDSRAGSAGEPERRVPCRGRARSSPSRPGPGRSPSSVRGRPGRRPTCVSTTIPAILPKALPRITLAVLSSHSRERSGDLLPPREVSAEFLLQDAAPARRGSGALLLKKPVGRMSRSSSPGAACA